ncbi:MAG: tetratricopeptide repeat protein [Burkholderiaceae bacterium]
MDAPTPANSGAARKILSAVVVAAVWLAVRGVGHTAGDGPDPFALYSSGRIAEAQRGYLALAARGDPIAAYNAAVIRLRDEVDFPAEEEALARLRDSAERGFAPAQLMLATLLERGDRLPASQPEALVWFERAAAQGDVDAQVGAATQYFLGRGATRDPVKARRWYEAAARGGDVGAQYILGSMLENGDGGEVDLSQAQQWYAQAARTGDPAARIKARELAERMARDAAEER